MSAFHHVLVNNLVANIINFTVWFALTFWVFLETRSVFATGMIAGLYLVLTAGLGLAGHGRLGKACHKADLRRVSRADARG